MSNSFEDRDIERIIFRGRLESSEIEPSEKFWNKALEGIIQRETRISNVRTARWRGAFFISGTVALLLGSYIIYMHNEVKGIKQELVQIEKTRIITGQQGVQQNNMTTAARKITVAENTAPNDVQPAKSANITIPLNTVSSFATAPKERTSYINHSQFTTNLPLNAHQILSAAEKINATENVSGNTSSAGINNSHNGNTNNGTGASPAETSTSLQMPRNNSPVPPSPAPVSSVQLSKPILSNKKMDSMANVSSLDSNNSPYTAKNPVTFAGIVSKMSVSLFYAPGWTNDFLDDKENDPANMVTANELKAEVDGHSSYAFGMCLSYDISSKWSVQTGCNFKEYTYTIDPTVVYAQQQETGKIGYSLPTSSGIDYIPYDAKPAHLGDSLEVSGTSSRGYICIPLQLRYKFAAGRVFDFYISGGFSANIAVYKESQINIESNALYGEELTVQNIYGLNDIQYSYNLGLGANYLVRQGLSVFAEPTVEGSITPINKNTPVIVYPYIFGLIFGVKYHF